MKDMVKKFIIIPNKKLFDDKKDKTTIKQYKNKSLIVFSKGFILKFSFKRIEEVKAIGYAKIALLIPKNIQEAKNVKQAIVPSRFIESTSKLYFFITLSIINIT